MGLYKNLRRYYCQYGIIFTVFMIIIFLLIRFHQDIQEQNLYVQFKIAKIQKNDSTPINFKVVNFDNETGRKMMSLVKLDNSTDKRNSQKIKMSNTNKRDDMETKLTMADVKTHTQKMMSLKKPADHPQNKRRKQNVKLSNKPSKVKKNLGLNATHINGVLMEPVNANYTRNIYFTVKTTHKYYRKRLLPLMLTWLQVVDKNKLSVITEKDSSNQNYVDMIRRAGFDIIDTDCLAVHAYAGLCCKTGIELATYYKVVEEHPGEEDKYQWFCHSDDDVYVNVPKLSQLLQKYDPRKPYYIGKWVKKRPNLFLTEKQMQNINQNNYTLKNAAFRYATGSTYCMSHAVMMEAKKFFNGADTFKKISRVPYLPDDMTVGFVIGSLLGYNLTDPNAIMNQYDFHMNANHSASLKQLTDYLTVSRTIGNITSVKKLASSLKKPLSSNEFMLYHCLLYPTVSWCKSVRELLKGNNI